METAGIAVLATAAATIIAAVTGWLQKRTDEKRGVRADDREDLTSQQDRYERYIERVEGRLNDLESDIETLRTDLREERRRYRVAIEYLRVLIRWIDSYLPSETRPAAPDILTDDL